MGSVPAHLRPAVAERLRALVRGENPDLLVWVARYGRSGAELVDQPDAAFEHERTDVFPRADGSYAVDLPLWTADESPSDLTATLTVSPDGVVSIDDVRVL